MQRAVLFWGVCIPLRLSIASSIDRIPAGRLAAGLLGIWWLAGRETSHVGFFGGPAFWREERPLHGALWTAYAVSGMPRWLYADAALGAVNWVVGKSLDPS